MALVFSAPFIAGPTWYSDELVQNSFTYISNISGIGLQYGGPMGSYLYTSNSDKSIRASINFAPKLNSANKLSLSFWLKVDPNDYVGVDPFQQLISLLVTSNTVNEERFRLEWDGSGYVWFGNAVTNSTGGAGYNASAWKSNNWNHCILTIDIKESETICNFRVNGINYNTTFPGGSFTFKDYVIINYSQLIFSICGLRIYNHILSEYEMLELERAPVLHYSFDDNRNISANYDYLNYIESNGTQQINTEVLFNPEVDSMEITFQSTDVSQNGMMLANSNTTNHFWFYYYATTNKIDLYIKNSTSQYRIATINRDTNKHTARYSGKSLFIDGKIYGTFSQSFTTCETPLYITSWGDQYFWKGKIYGCKLWKSDNLVRDFVPVKDRITGRYGMLDKVTKRFYFSSGSENYTGN